ncbi:MAG: cytochrome b5 domain-containing protein [Actinomycetota bacterium]
MPFDLVLGLPVHPLVVHFAIVLLIVGALGFIAIVLIPRWRAALGWAVIVLLALGCIAAFAANQSGEALSERVGLPQEHAEWGDRLFPASLALLAIALAWYLWQRRSSGAAVTALGVLGILVAAGTIALTTVVGHSGAEAVWASRVAPASADTTQADASGDATISMTEVAAHATPDDCWSVVNGNVYNLTAWISQHPGGPQVIEGMCGIDATQAFTDMHGGQAEPEQVLAGYEVGPLG